MTLHAHGPATSAEAEIQTILTFKLAGETFGIPVSLVSEIIDPQKQTRVPNAGPLAPSLVNVRGSIVPVIDLHHRLGMQPVDVTTSSRMLVLELIDGEARIKLALMADEVDEVVEAIAQEIETVPDLGIRWPAECFQGIVKREDTLVIVLDAPAALGPQLAA